MLDVIDPCPSTIQQNFSAQQCFRDLDVKLKF